VNYELRIRPEVVDEVAEAVRWYEQHDEGLGREFLRAYYSCLAFVQRNPEARARAYRLFRRSLLRRFPYAVFYAAEGGELVIVLVAHCARDPDWLREQLGARSGRADPPDQTANEP